MLTASVVGIGVLFVMDYLVLGISSYPFRQFEGGKAVAVLACLMVIGLSFGGGIHSS